MVEIAIPKQKGVQTPTSDSHVVLYKSVGCLTSAHSLLGVLQPYCWLEIHEKQCHQSEWPFMPLNYLPLLLIERCTRPNQHESQGSCNTNELSAAMQGSRSAQVVDL